MITQDNTAPMAERDDAAVQLIEEAKGGDLHACPAQIPVVRPAAPSATRLPDGCQWPAAFLGPVFSSLSWFSEPAHPWRKISARRCGKNAVIQEAENIRLGRMTFEDTDTETTAEQEAWFSEPAHPWRKISARRCGASPA